MITIVSGLPRCGTSMMMQMLEAGGMHVLSDKTRVADDDNPRGYYELEKVKQIRKDSSWLKDAEGKVFKMVSMLLRDLPPERKYRILFMERNMDEMLESQAKMLSRKGDTPKASERALADYYRKHLDQLAAWLEAQENLDVLFCDYKVVLDEPLSSVRQIAAFLGKRLDTAAMVKAVDKTLYRNRRHS